MRDPHAEFRRGRWQKPAAFVGLAAVALGALFWLVPGAEQEPSSASTARTARPAAPTIGASLPPDRIAEPEPPRLDARPSEPSPAPERPAGIVAERDFASAFKAAAHR